MESETVKWYCLMTGIGFRLHTDKDGYYYVIPAELDASLPDNPIALVRRCRDKAVVIRSRRGMEMYANSFIGSVKGLLGEHGGCRKYPSRPPLEWVMTMMHDSAALLNRMSEAYAMIMDTELAGGYDICAWADAWTTFLSNTVPVVVDDLVVASDWRETLYTTALELDGRNTMNGMLESDKSGDHADEAGDADSGEAAVDQGKEESDEVIDAECNDVPSPEIQLLPDYNCNDELMGEREVHRIEADLGMTFKLCFDAGETELRKVVDLLGVSDHALVDTVEVGPNNFVKLKMTGTVDCGCSVSKEMDLDKVLELLAVVDEVYADIRRVLKTVHEIKTRYAKSGIVE